MLSGLTGQGIEFGAELAPCHVPLECQVRYADVFTIERMSESSYDGQVLADLIVPDLVSSFEQLQGIEALVDTLSLLPT